MRNFEALIGTSVLLCVAAFAQKTKTVTAPPNYVLGPGDQVAVQVTDVADFNARTYRIDTDGTIGLPLVGRVKVEGLTLAQFEGELSTELRKQIIEPHVVASIAEPRSQPLSVLGAVNNPGTQQVQGSKTLFDAIAAAGGLRPDAGDAVTVTRERSQGPLDLPDAVVDPATGRTTAVVKLSSLVNLRDSATNILVRPHDAISVPRAQLVYVIGNVRKAGGFTFSDGRSISALEALSMAEGLAPNASPKKAKILRKRGPDDTTREQIPVNLQNILAGKTTDVKLDAEDILFVPDNLSRRVTTRTLETAINTISGIAIWRGF